MAVLALPLTLLACDVEDDVLPRLTVTSPHEGEELTPPFPIVIETTAELGDGEDAYHLRVFRNGSEVGATTSTSFDIEGGPPGPNAVHVSLMRKGQLAGAEDDVTVIVHLDDD